MKRIYLTCLIVLALMISVVPALAQDEPVTLTISTWAGVDEAAELQEILDEINENNTAFRIVHEPIPADYYPVIQTQLAGGVGADLYWVDQNNMALAADGVFMDLSECLANAEPGSVGDIDDYYPNVISTAIHNGGIYGLPWIAQPVVTYYNIDLFDAAELEYPEPDWDWNDFVDLAKALTLDTDGDGQIDQYGFTNDGWPPPFIFIWQAGGELINEDFTEAPIDTPEFLEGFEFFLSTAFNPEMSPSRETIAEQGSADLFKAGKIAMFMGGAADDLDRIPDLNVGVVRVPAHPETGSHTTFAWNASTVVNANTDHPELACEALLAVTEAIHHWKIVSPRISQANAEHLIDAEPRKADSAEAIIEAAQDMRALPIFGNYQRFDGVFWGEFWGPLMNNETDLTVAELAAEVRPELEALLP